MLSLFYSFAKQRATIFLAPDCFKIVAAELTVAPVV